MNICLELITRLIFPHETFTCFLKSATSRDSATRSTRVEATIRKAHDRAARHDSCAERYAPLYLGTRIHTAASGVIESEFCSYEVSV